MSTITKVTRTVKKLEVPRPLKSTTSVSSRQSLVEVKVNSVEDLIYLTEAVACQISQGNTNAPILQTNISNMYKYLKLYGVQLESSAYKDLMDRFFIVFRNGSQDEKLDKVSRLHLLELIELRAKHWQSNDCMSMYYNHRVTHEPQLTVSSDITNLSGSIVPILATPQPERPILLGPGEIIKTSGKFNKPTKIPGKNYSKDEVVIRNADSGKVMGIKGRRVHMIEELSDTIISFQRVSPGAKERLVQITGPNEENVNHAKHLIGDTIRRNASPVRLEGATASGVRGSGASLDSDASDESPRPVLPHKRTVASPRLQHSYSTSDAAIGEYMYTVSAGKHSIRITGDNLDLVKTSKIVLDEYFESLAAFEQGGEGSGDFFTMWQRPHDPSLMGTFNGLSSNFGDDDVFIKNNEDTTSDSAVRRARFSRAISVDKKEVERSLSRQTYTREILLNYSASPLSQQRPPLTLPPELQRKNYIMFDGEAYLKNDGLLPGSDIVGLSEDIPDSPEPE